MGLALSMLALGCTPNGPEDETPTVTPDGEVAVTINATLPSGEWVEGDEVAINGATAPAVAAEQAGKSTASFVVYDVEAPVVVVAPAALLSGLNEITVPSVQDYVADGYDRSVYGVYGIATELLPVEEGDDKNLAADVALQEIFGVVSLPLTLDAASATAPVAISQLSLTSLAGAALNGTWSASVSVNEGVPTIGLTAEEVSATTDLVCGEEGVQISEAPVYFNFVVPAGVYAGGFEIVAADVDGHNFIITLPEDVTVEPGLTVELAPAVFTVVEKAPATLKVTIAEEGITWQEGDAVVANNELSSNEVAASSVGTQTAEFSFEAVAYPYSVFYPAELYTTSGSLRFYDEQPLVGNGYDHTLLAMAGYSTTNEVTLHNLCGLVTIPLTNKYEGETIYLEKIVVETAQGDPIAGKYHINYRTGKVDVVSGKSVLTLVNGTTDADFIAIAPEETVNVTFVIPAGTVRSGLKLDIYSSVGIVEDKVVFPTGLDVRGGQESVADAYIYEEVKIDAIRTAEELLDFAKCVNMGRYKKFINENGEVVLGNDIDMSTLAEWVPITGVIDESTGLYTGFDGIFNGQDFKITNWATNKPLFGYLGLGATVKNLVIDSTCNLIIPEVLPYTLDSKPTSNTCFGFVVASNLAGTVENVINNAEVICSCPNDEFAASRAAIVGYSNPGSYVRKCINNGNLTFELGNHAAQTGYIGTVSGRFASSADHVPSGLYDCENHGKLTINIIDNNQTKNFYLGGISGSANSYTVVSNCKNYGDFTFNTPNSGALVCMGGVIGYSAGEMTNCYNEGNISHISSGQLKGAIVAGIVGYQNAPISGCVNKGNIYNTGTMFGGRNSVGGIDGTKSSSSAAPATVGVVAYCYNATVDNCENYGEVFYNLTKADGSGTSGRTVVAGIVGSTWGDVTNCKNFGLVKNVQKYDAAQPNHLTYVGGISGCDYYAKSQSESNIINCVNEGDIIFDNSVGTSNNACGGIVGWPGKEGSVTTATQNCVNKGNITVSGTGKVRLGGIQGGSGRIQDCQNSGSITINETNSGSVYGGIAGFHSGGYELTGSTNTGDIVSNVPVTGGGVGGLMGNIGNAAHGVGLIANNVVKCLVRSVEGTCGVGMIVGHFNGKTKEIHFGSADQPISVGGTFQLGDTVVAIDATNVADPAVLANGCSNFLDTMHFFSTVLAQ